MAGNARILIMRGVGESQCRQLRWGHWWVILRAGAGLLLFVSLAMGRQVSSVCLYYKLVREIPSITLSSDTLIA